MSTTSRLAGWWKHMIKKRPILTNSVVFASFYSAAEFSQQSFNKYYSKEKVEFDFASAGRIIAIGGTVYPPTLYFWYKFLDRRFVGKALSTVFTKVVADQFVLTPVLLATFYTLLGILERKEDIFEELRTKYWKTFIANQAFWIPAQTINFLFMPNHMRVVYVATASFIWINFLCFIIRQKDETKDEHLLSMKFE